MDDKDSRDFWEGQGVPWRVEQLARELVEGKDSPPSDESIGLFLHDTLARTLRELGNGIYSRQANSDIPPIPHDLAARYLHQCVEAIRILSEFEERRSRSTDTSST